MAAPPAARGHSMKRIRSSLISLLFTAAVALPLLACSHPAEGHGFVHFERGGISLRNGAVLIKVKGHDTARVSSTGGLRIGDADIAVSPQGQAALEHYNATAQIFTDQAMNLGLDSADFALHTLGQVFEGLVQGTPDRAGREAEQGSRVIEARARGLCLRIQEWRLAQDAAAEAVPAFRPYAVIRGEDLDDCQAGPGKDRAPGAAQIAS